MENLFDLQPNKVSRNLTQYPLCITAPTGWGKTWNAKRILEEFSEDGKKPLFLMFEDRYAGIPGIMAVRVRSIPELKKYIQQLRNPKAKEMYSCVVIDTVQKFEAMAIKYVCDSKDAEILDDIGAWGKGTKYYRSALQILEEIKNIGLPLHYVSQSIPVNIDDELVYQLRLTDKNTLGIVTQDSYMIGFVYPQEDDKGNKEWYITFSKSDKIPDLKDTFGLPKQVKIKDLKKELIKAIDTIDEKFVTEDVTIQRTEEEKIPFEELISKISELGKSLAKANRKDEALSVLKKNIGVEEDGSVKRPDSLIESQRDVAEVVLIELESLIEKYKIK